MNEKSFILYFLADEYKDLVINSFNQGTRKMIIKKEA